MPNGGSDCCGTCWLNTVNIGRDADHYCQIRDFAPKPAFWTYCANHQHHNRAKVRVPVGAVYGDLDEGAGRFVKYPAPDSEEVRLQLLELLDEMSEEPRDQYPTSTRFDHEIIKHLHAIKETRTEKGLVRLLSFEPFRVSGDSFLSTDNVGTISYALEALGCIQGTASVQHIRPWVTQGLDRCLQPYDPDEDRYAPLRYHAIRALRHMSRDAAADLLEVAVIDAHAEIRAFAIEIRSHMHR